MLDVSKLNNVKIKEQKTIAACPACRAAGGDKQGNHLVVYDSGKFGCAAHEGDAIHRKEIFSLVGIPEKMEQTTKTQIRKRIVARYNYTDLEETLIHQTVRYEPKDFRQRRPDEKGKWKWSLKGIDTILYNLPKIAKASPGEHVWIVEGEKDADTLIKAGHLATTCPMGAGKWRSDYNKFLEARHVILCPDNDHKGLAHMTAVAQSLKDKAASVRIVILKEAWQECPPKGDISDYIAQGGNPTKLINTAQKPAESEPLGYYDSVRKEYLIKNPSGRWLALTVASMKRRLKAMGYSPRTGDTVSEVDSMLIELEDKYDVSYAAPLAGRMAGFHQHNATRILVTESPQFIQPSPGDWPVIDQLIKNLFVIDQNDEIARAQINAFYGWLKTAITALRGQKPQHGQALAIAGEAQCGKSFLQHHIITPCLGGREAKGARYMMGKTEFNGELFAAEHITLEDEFMSTRTPDRIALGASIKNFTVSTDNVSCHFKGRTAINLAPWWRVSMSLNDDPEALRVLPPLNADIRDKIIILHASKHPMPMDTSTPDKRNAFLSTVREELPAFIHWLMESYFIPDDMKCARYGIQTWHHPRLVEDLLEIAPENQLLAMIDRVLWQVEDEPWKGTAEQLRQELLDDNTTRREAEKLLEWHGAAGTYLGRIASSTHGERVKKDRTKNARNWIIHPPNKD